MTAINTYVLVSGWPGSGKTTLATGLANALSLPLIAKDVIKEALMDALGPPIEVEESRKLGGAAVRAMLAMARTCPGAVMDSTWFPYSRPLIEELVGKVVEVHCSCPVEVARDRYRARAATRHSGHLDALRTDSELFAEQRPLEVDRYIEVDTTKPVDVRQLARAIRE